MTDAIDASQTAAPEALGEHNDLPNPITNTIPEAEEKPEPKAKPEAKASPEEKRSKSVQDAIDKALKDGDGDDVKPEPKKAKAKEPVSDEEGDDSSEADTKADKGKGKALEKPQEAQGETVEDRDGQDAPKRPSAYREPPSGFDDAAKAEWEATPESVRGAMNRRFKELESGIEKYRQMAQEYEPVRQYAEMAKQSGTTLDQALERYVGMEQQLRQDPMAGLQAVVANLDLKKPDGSPVTLRDIAAHIMGQKPDQIASRQEATISRLTQQVQQLTQQLGGVSKHFEQQQQQAKVSSAQTTWDSFQRDYPRAAELEPQIAEFLTKYPAPEMPVGERLRDAYNWAVAQNPNVAHTDSQPLVQTQDKPPSNPAGQKSISGAPGRTDAKSVSRKTNRSAAVEKAMRAAGL